MRQVLCRSVVTSSRCSVGSECIGLSASQRSAYFVSEGRFDDFDKDEDDDEESRGATTHQKVLGEIATMSIAGGCTHLLLLLLARREDNISLLIVIVV